MIEVDVIASSSNGNCYRLKSGSSHLLLEAGIPYYKIGKAIKNKWGNLDGVLVTHEHNDHAQAVWHLQARGLDIYMSEGTKAKLGVNAQYAKVVAPLKLFKIGKWEIMPFDTMHDAAEPLGFLISDGEDKLLFATDTYYVPYRFNGITLLMLECNYADELLQSRVNDGVVSLPQAHRLARSHFSLANVMKFISCNDLSAVRQIWLLHGSKVNGNPILFEAEIKKLTGKPVIVCEG